jgi:hypothetical protein
LHSAMLNRFSRGLVSSTAMGVATALAAAMSSWSAAIAISGRLEGRHLGGGLKSVGRVGRKVPGST